MTFALAVTRTGAGVSAAAADRSKRSTQLSYYQQDHLGSIATISDETGTVIERLAYDPWGKRRYANGTSDNADSIVGVNTDRGYTLHEHLDEVGVIHMNGRVYDPLIGRFMSADPFIQSPGNLQSYNRYAYVWNNPMSLTDPSGYWSWKSLLRTVVTIAVAYYTGQWISGSTWAMCTVTGATWSPVVAGAAGGFAGGFTNSALSGGNLRQDITGGLQGSVSGALFGAAGGVGEADSYARYAAHASAGCISSVASGGNCGQGATSAVFGKYTTNSISGFGDDGTGSVIARGVATSVAGGVGSVIAGGKFENGATTAAFGYLFNACGNGKCFNFNAKNVENYYRGGSGKDISVNVNEIDTLLHDSEVTWTPTERSDRYVLSTLGRDGGGELSQGRVLGDLTVQRTADGSFRILSDYYNFEQHGNPDNNLKIAARNMITAYGAWRVGQG